MNIHATPEAGNSTVAGLAAAAVALSDRKASKAGKTLGYVMLVQAAVHAGKAWWKQRLEAQDYTIAVAADDDIYVDLHSWLLDKITPADRRSLTARSSRRATYGAAIPIAVEEATAQLRLFYDGRSSQTFVVDGHRIKVNLDEPGSSDLKDMDLARWLRKERLVFTCRGEQARDAMVAVLEQLVANLAVTREPRVFVARRWGGWMRTEDAPPRSLDSVVLAAGVKEQLVNDLERFLGAEADYIKLGIPYHRSYLLHGEPGTGKSSVAKALANYFGLDLRYVPLSVIDNDQALLETLSDLGARSVLLLEDVDIAHAARDRDDTQRGVTLSGLLNGLDGVITPHGLVTVMTTNNIDVLDDALIRPGRVDRSFELGPVDDRQFADLVAVMGVPADLPPLNGRRITPAEVVGVLTRCIGDPAKARRQLESLVTNTPPLATRKA